MLWSFLLLRHADLPYRWIEHPFKHSVKCMVQNLTILHWINHNELHWIMKYEYLKPTVQLIWIFEARDLCGSQSNVISYLIPSSLNPIWLLGFTVDPEFYKMKDKQNFDMSCHSLSHVLDFFLSKISIIPLAENHQSTYKKDFEMTINFAYDFTISCI